MLLKLCTNVFPRLRNTFRTYLVHFHVIYYGLVNTRQYSKNQSNLRENEQARSPFPTGTHRQSESAQEQAARVPLRRPQVPRSVHPRAPEQGLRVRAQNDGAGEVISYHK